jgi:hypothetical protein
LLFGKLSSSALAAVLVPALLGAQQPTAPPAGAPGPKTLQIAVLQGEGARNSILAGTSTPPLVEVRDQSGKPVAGAEVTFRLPASGPSGVFSEWMRTETVRTNPQGQAKPTGLIPNAPEGRFQILVTAAMGKATAEAAINQTNIDPPPAPKRARSAWWKPVIVGFGIAGLLSIIFLAKR